MLTVKDVEKATCFKDLIGKVDNDKITDELKIVISETKNNVEGYLNYLDNLHFGSVEPKPNVIDKLWDRLNDCAKRREDLARTGCRLPCNACKYANRSLLILMDKMFVDNEYKASIKDSKAFTLLKYTSQRHVRYLRREHLSALANSAEQLADIMLSCACTNFAKEKEDHAEQNDVIDSKTIGLLSELSATIIHEDDRRKIIDSFVSDVNRDGKLGKLDRALLYYWSACRYYEIASMYRESEHCIERIAKVLEDYLSVSGIKIVNEEVNKWITLLDNLFTHASRTVGRQYDNFDMAEIHEIKWLFHLEHSENIDLSTLTQFPNLQSLFLSLIRSKVKLNGFTKEGNKSFIHGVYNRVAPALRHECTFMSEVEQNYTKAMLNWHIFVELMGADFMEIYRESLSSQEKKYYQASFFERLAAYLESEEQRAYEVSLFHIKPSVTSRLDLLDHLVFDSLVCLYNILRILPPHHQYTTFTNSFIADVYYNLWEWSKYYEMFYDLYYYYRCYDISDKEGMKTIVSMMERLADDDTEHKNHYDDLMERCAKIMQDGGVACKDNFGYRYTKLFMNLRHEMDDATIHHIYTNYSAEMAVKYYRAARGINSEGMEYKNLIYGMYVLDDDLHNDTCQSNLADERYMLNSGMISMKRKQLQKMYEDSNINKVKNYETARMDKDSDTQNMLLDERYVDSLFTNTEY